MRFLSEPDVVTLTGISRDTIRRLERKGMFPARRRLSPGRVGWLQSEIELWIEARR